jgi:hypothetical protein
VHGKQERGCLPVELPEKIRALLAKAGNTPYEQEAATFYAKAQELMEKYAIDEEALWAGTERANTEKPIVEVLTFKGDGAYDKFRLYSTLAKYNRCQAWKDDGIRNTYVTKVVGYPSDIAFISLMLTSLLLQMNTSMVFAMFDEDGNTTRSWKINFAEGYVDRIQVRIKEAHAARQGDGTSTDLVVAREQKVDDYIKNDLGMSFTSLRGPSRQYNPAAQSAGRNAANKADLGINAKLRKQRELT